MRVPLSQLTDEQIRSADVITAINPNTGAERQLFGQEEVARFRPYPSGPYEIQVLEVEIAASDNATFQELRQRVATIKVAQQEESAKNLVEKHYELEVGLTRVIRYSGSADLMEQAKEPIKLLEVNKNTVPAGVMPLGFDAAPDAGIRFPSVIIEVTPEEFEKIRTKQLKLPKGWEIQREEVSKPLDGSGGA
jgi:hypothetical protein